MRSAVRSVLFLLAVCISFAAWPAPGEAAGAASRGKKLSRAEQGKKKARAAAARRPRPPARTAREQAFADFARRYLEPASWAIGRSGPSRVVLSRNGGSSETFTVSNRTLLLRGRVWEARGGIGGRVYEAYAKVNGKWVPTENPWE